MKDNGIRINKFISQSGLYSRRKAEEMISNKKVKVNGQYAHLGQIIYKDDIVEVNDKKIGKFPEKKYYLLNKPKKTICTLKDNFNRTIVTSLIHDKDYLFPVGRLDYDTTGVILITNDGELSNRLIHPSSNIERIYHARINEPLNKREFDFLNSNDVLINGKPSKQVIEQVENKSYLVYLYQGSYHHVKKIFEQVDKNVLNLKRISFAGLTCKNMPIGSYRKLKPFEIKQLKKLVNM
ncbi:MAG: rRNA pseudouridine synthase [Mycoplasma sp.]|nr:rRNA pseudouridine synthase [Mycoplasma sp.]